VRSAVAPLAGGVAPGGAALSDVTLATEKGIIAARSSPTSKGCNRDGRPPMNLTPMAPLFSYYRANLTM
jgi:hypothetical protein